jgi:basic amino acid/polyamine antiporter, APA family
MDGAAPDAAGTQRTELRRVLGAWDAAALIVGVMIGSGIFATPPIVAGYLPGSAGFLGIWALGGLAALCGALCFAELTGMFPFTGGSYAFLREAYGRFPSFAYGWSALLITYPASIAAVSVVFTAYLARLVPMAESTRPWVAALLCLVLTGLNIIGVRLGAWTLRLMTGAKVLALGLVALAGILIGRKAGTLPPVTLPGGTIGWSAAGLALAFTSVVWTYEGWADGPTIAGETRHPHRDVPRALLFGTLAVTGIYLLANLAYLLVLGLSGLRGTDRVAVTVAEAAFGNRGGSFVTLLVLVSTLGSIMGMIIAASRVFFAMGRDQLFFGWVGNVHARLKTPAAALTGVGIVSALYAVLGTFEGIIRYFVFVSGLFFLLIIGSVFLHRRRRPDAPRPVRIPFYPVPPVLYLIVEVALLVQLLKENAGPSLIGLAIVLASVPVYLVWERARRPA